MLRNKTKKHWGTGHRAQGTGSGNLGFFIFLFTCALCLVPCVFSFAQEAAYVYDSGGRRDPFTPLITPDGRLVQIETKLHSGELRLEGIIFDKNGASFAIINGSVVSAGESVDDIKVTKILEDKIIFEKGGKVFEQELSQGG